MHPSGCAVVQAVSFNECFGIHLARLASLPFAPPPLIFSCTIQLRRCPMWLPNSGAGLGERRRGPLVAVLVGAFVSLLIGIAVSLLDPLRHAQEIFCGPPSVQRVHALPRSDLLEVAIPPKASWPFGDAW